jgi:hypothetical protein
MTSDEVVSKEIEAIENILYSDLNLSEGTKQALQTAITHLQDYQKLREKIDMNKIADIIFECGSAYPCDKAKAIVIYLQQPTEH